VEPFSVLYGHNDKITSVLANSELGVKFSSSPRLIVIHDLSKGEFIRKIIITDAAMDKTATNLNLNLLAVESRYTGNFVVYSQLTILTLSYFSMRFLFKFIQRVKREIMLSLK